MLWLRRFFYKYVKYLPLLNRWFNWQALVFACEKKITYPRSDSAQRAAEKMNKKPTTRNELEHYLCKFCGQWHVGRIDTYEKKKREGRLAQSMRRHRYKGD